ncbi:hypothetical protein TRIUR3_16671 [Triticum urartu]|uniref:Ubiquitin-like protease family profile domain-containing protein n=1 Tax=Triticum urartu TaxID=4572 RepID=M8ALF4_TRIUA|nr:hypothetical protein TRIUR3_16671 [Triticum urartu]
MSARKRNNQHLLPNEENGNNPPKRKKDVSNEDNLQLFVKFLSELNDTQKNIVRKLGFASLLQISCACNIDDIFMWLALQFNTATCTLELRNGFNFEFNTSIVHKILGIPLLINSTPTKECVDIINNFVQSSAPTTEHLIAMITDNISEEIFSTIFLLLTISSLIAPNAKGSPSKKFYSALQNISSAGKYNWCLSTLSYLVAHFEFLITSEFKFPIDILPRLPFWSSSLLKTFTALDTMHGVHLQFGRLPEKALLEDMTKKFWQTIISNSIPTTERYIDDLHSTISKSFTHINNEMTESANEQITSPNNHISLHQQAEQIYSNKYFKDPTTFLSSHDFLDFAMPYSNPPNWEKEDGDSSIQWLDKKFSQCLLLENSSGIDDLFQKRSPTFEDLFVIDKINKQYDYPDIDFLQDSKLYCLQQEKAANRFGTPIPDPIMYQVLEDYEAECLLRDKAAAEQPPLQNFSSASKLHITTQLNSEQVIFSTAAQADFFKMMSSLLPHIDISQRIFQIDNVWVDQKTLTVSMRPGGWMNPHTLDCYSKMLNTDLLNRGRQGLIPSNEPIVHIVGTEDMVHLPCFNDKQWIVITANFDSGKFFDIMNPDGSGNNKFTSIISTVTFNFKSLFAKTYPNCIAFNIKEFDYRFVPVPRTHFRYDTGIFLLQILKTYRGMGVPGFTTHDLQALREIFLYEIATCSNSEVQLPLVKAFQQNHGFRLFR